MTFPELRITDAEMLAFRGWREAVIDIDGVPCFDEWTTYLLPHGASARIGAILVARLPHLRHAVWPPKVERLSRAGVASVLAVAMAGARSVGP